MNGNRIATIIFWIGIVIIVCFLFFASRPFGPSDKAMWKQMDTIVKSLVKTHLASGKASPEAEIEAMGNKELDAWGRPFKTSFRDGILDLQSAGPDGAWNTKDDFHAQAIIGQNKTTGVFFRGPGSRFEFPNESRLPQSSREPLYVRGYGLPRLCEKRKHRRSRDVKGSP